VDNTAPVDTSILWADTSEPGDMVIPVGGTTGQALVKVSGSDYDTDWSSAILPTIIDAKGDLIVGTAADTASRLAVGATNGHVLSVDSTTAEGMKWASLPDGIAPIQRPKLSSTLVWTVPGYGMVDRNASISLTANTLYYFPFTLNGTWSPTEFAIHVTSIVSSSTYAWIYRADADLAVTGTPVLDITAAGAFNTSTQGTKTITGFTTSFTAGNYFAVLGATGSISLNGAGILATFTDPTQPFNNNTWLFRRTQNPIPTTAPSSLTNWDTYTQATGRSVFPLAWR
jgi:hypothetical protein